MGIVFHDAIRADVGARTDFGRLRNERRRMESRRVARSLVEEFNSVGEGQVGIGGAECSKPGHASLAFYIDSFLHKNGRSARGLQQREVAPVGKKGDLAGFGVFDPGDAVDGSFAGAFETAAELLGNFGEVHGQLLGAGWESRTAQRGKYSQGAYSLKRRGWMAAAGALGLRRAMPTTPRTVSSLSAG